MPFLVGSGVSLNYGFWIVIVSYPSLWEATHHYICNLCSLFSTQRIYMIKSLSNINKSKSFVSSEKEHQKKSLFSLAILLSKTNNKKGNLVAYITEKSRGRNGFGQALIWQICEVTKDVISFHFFTPPSMVVCPFLHGIRILGASTWLYVSSFDNQ